MQRRAYSRMSFLVDLDRLGVDVQPTICICPAQHISQQWTDRPPMIYSLSTEVTRNNMPHCPLTLATMFPSAKNARPPKTFVAAKSGSSHNTTRQTHRSGNLDEIWLR